MRNPVPKLNPIFVEPPEDVFVTDAMVHLTYSDAATIVQDMGFERQRDADFVHIGMLADMMMNDEFASGSQITFAIDRDGDPKLVDGQHRLRAAVQAQWDGLWNARCLWGDAHPARGVYTLLDSSQKKRPPAVIGKALGFDQLTPKTQGIIISASKYQNQWRDDYELPAACKVPPVRDNISRAEERMSAFVAVDQIINGGNVTSQAKRKLATGMVMAVMVETLEHNPAEANPFWRDVATNGDGIAGELRNALIEGKPAKSSQFYAPRLAGHAWNQRDGERLRKENKHILRVEGTQLVIPA